MPSYAQVHILNLMRDKLFSTKLHRRDPAMRPRLAFLLGIGKSGTNWAGSLLNLHPNVLCEGEFHFQYFLEAHRRFTQGAWLVGSRAPVASATRSALEDLVRRGMLAAIADKPAVEVVVDRTPRHFEVLIPGTPHLYIMRDGRDALVSFTFHFLRQGDPDQLPPDTRKWFLPHWEAFQRDPNGMTGEFPGLLGVEPWVRYHVRRWADQIKQDRAAIASTAAVDPSTSVLSIRYEDLHEDTETWRARMYTHLGLPPEVAAPLSPESRTTPGFGREDRTSFYRKGQVGDWRTYATDDFRRWVKEEAGQALIDCGYETSSAW